MSETSYPGIEEKLRNAAREVKTNASEERDIVPVIKRAKNQVAVRDLMSFGFAHILRALISMLAGIHRHAESRKIEKGA